MSGVTASKLLFLDTNIFVYYFAGEGVVGRRAKKVLQLLAQDRARAVTSTITQLELLSLSVVDQEVEQLNELFLETPNLRIVVLDQDIAVEAARIRRQYHFRTPDAIQLATALVCQVDQFVSQDKQLAQFSELAVVSL